MDAKSTMTLFFAIRADITEGQSKTTLEEAIILKVAKISEENRKIGQKNFKMNQGKT